MSPFVFNKVEHPETDCSPQDLKIIKQFYEDNTNEPMDKENENDLYSS